MKRLWWIISPVLTLALLLTACVAPAANTAPATTSSGGGEAKDFVTWYQFDQNNQDPASDEHVGNDYLRKSIPAFNEQFKGKWNWINQPKAFDKMTTELIAAVQAGGDVPDVMHIGTSDLLSFVQNGAVQDLTDWAKAQPWYADVDPNALAVCQGPDGKLYCIPVAQTPQIVFVWKDRFPNGYPTTPEDFMVQAEKLKAAGHDAITFMGSTDYS